MSQVIVILGNLPLLATATAVDSIKQQKYGLRL
jgi:hypothetical protein